MTAEEHRWLEWKWFGGIDEGYDVWRHVFSTWAAAPVLEITGTLSDDFSGALIAGNWTVLSGEPVMKVIREC